jgi:hypothetical protein
MNLGAGNGACSHATGQDIKQKRSLRGIDMNQMEIERTLTLHKLAYGLLIWLKEQARNNRSLLDSKAVEAMSSAKSCEEWLSCHLSMIPVNLRPGSNDISAFSYLFSSFFSTSFRIGAVRWWDTVETTLVTGAKSFCDRRHKKHSERREAEAAAELKRLALSALAEEAELRIYPLLTQTIVIPQTISNDLTLWTYVRELVRRTEFASQGSPVHRLWLELDERTRKNLSIEMVWRARANLILWLSEEAARTSSEEREIRNGKEKEAKI